MRHEPFPRPHNAMNVTDMAAPRPMVGIVNGAIGSFVLWVLIAGVIFAAH